MNILREFTTEDLQTELDRRELNKEDPKTPEEYRILVDHLNNQPDNVIWEFVIGNADKILIIIDNDDTSGHFIDDEDLNLIRFSNYIGDYRGVEILLKTIGVNVEGV